MANKVYHYNLIGGEDKTSADVDIPNGVARSLYNYEQNYRTGYTRIGGYRKLVNDTTPGNGPIRGLIIYDDVVYMFRNHASDTSVGLWKAVPAVYNDAVSPATVTSNGSWTEITDIKDEAGVQLTQIDSEGYLQPDGYYEFVIHNFKATTGRGKYRGDFYRTGSGAGSGSNDVEYLQGEVVTDAVGTLGAVGLEYEALRNFVSSGTMQSADWQLLTNPTSTPSSSHDIEGSSGNLYGVDGKNPAFEFNGTQLKQIDSTYIPDLPMHIEANGNRLVLGFRAGEIAISELGDPHGFDPVYGAGSVGVTDFLTGMMAGPDNVLYIFAKNKIYLLSGMDGPLDQTEMKKHSKGVGAYPYSEQMLGGRALFWDQWGLTELEATDVFGDVVTNALSNKIQPLLVGKQPINSVVLKDKAQYRGYFQSTTGADSNTTCMIATLLQNPKEGMGNLGFTHAVYPFSIDTATAGRIANEDFHIVGAEITSSHEVYHMDIGTSFAGESYLSYIQLPFHHMGSPYITKKWKKVRMNLTAPSATSFQGQVDFSYGDDFTPSDYGEDSVTGEGTLWGEGTWGSFTWSASRHSQIEGYMNGHGENISVILQTDSATAKPHTLKDISYIYENLQIEH